MDTKAAQRQLVGLITQHLSESIPVTRILKYQPNKNGSVDGRFESLGRVFNFTFNGNDVKYKPSGNMDSDLFSEYYLQRFDAAPKAPKGTRALPKCTSKSYSCKGAVGVACITLTKNCRMGTTAIGNERLNKIKGLAKMLASSGGDTSKLEASQAKVVEQRSALAIVNRDKRTPKKIQTTISTKEKTVDKLRAEWQAATEQAQKATNPKDYKEAKTLSNEKYLEFRTAKDDLDKKNNATDLQKQTPLTKAKESKKMGFKKFSDEFKKIYLSEVRDQHINGDVPLHYKEDIRNKFLAKHPISHTSFDAHYDKMKNSGAFLTVQGRGRDGKSGREMLEWIH